MVIGIDGSRAFIGKRTGIEEYSYQVIKHLCDKFEGHRVFLYLRKNQKVDFSLPHNWQIKKIRFPRLWTQLGLSLEMLFYPVDALFIPAHIVPLVHPKNTIVVIHGLEYEMVPEAYSHWAKRYMRWSIKMSCRWAEKIICCSKNTKNDLLRLYKVPEEKMQVVYEGYDLDGKSQIPITKLQNYKPYLLFIGRLERRKNIIGIVNAFDILKKKFGIPHKLILAGLPGHGILDIKSRIRKSEYKSDIVSPGFIKDEEKSGLIKGADVFLFPSFYEGFGIPILEAQNAGVPVVTSNVSSMPEVAGNSAILVDPSAPRFIAQRTFDLLQDKNLRDGIIEKGYENVKIFSWEKCAQNLADIIKNEFTG